MTVSTRASSLPENSSLLEGAPPSYHTANNVNAHNRHANSLAPVSSPSRLDLCWILLGLWSGVFLGAFDGTVVATLLAPIGSEFQASHQSSYIGTAYLLSVCCFTPLYGRLADILGRKGAMLLALSLFGSGTLLCGFAPSMESLIMARAIAGMGGGGAMTVASIAVTDLIPLKQRGLYQGIANVLYGLGAALGGPLGGWVNDKFGWRAVFLMQAPILALSIVLVALKVNIILPDEVRNRTLTDRLRRIDFVGSITLVTAVGSFLLAFSLKTSEEMPWSDPLIFGLLLSSVVSTGLFIIGETRFAPFPVMPMRLMMQRTPLAVALSNLLGSISAFSMIYNVPLYFATVRLESALASGSRLLPHSVAISVGSIFAGWLMRKTGKLYALTLASSGMTIIASLLVASWSEGTSAARLWLDLVPQGFGMASLITSTLIAMIAAVYKEDMPIATGITYLFRTTGQVLGVSLSGALLQGVLTKKLRERIKGPDAAEVIYMIRHQTEVIPFLEPSLRRIAINCYADALRVVFISQVAVNILGFIACLPIEENPLSGGPPRVGERHLREEPQER